MREPRRGPAARARQVAAAPADALVGAGTPADELRRTAPRRRAQTGLAPLADDFARRRRSRVPPALAAVDALPCGDRRPAGDPPRGDRRRPARARPILAALALCCAAAPACADRRAPPPEPPGADAAPLPPVAERPSCRARWADSGAGTYDFTRDAEASALGNRGYATYAARAERERCRKTWTVLIYMAADSDDLPLHALWNIDDVEATPGAGSTLDHDVVVHLDLAGPGGLRRLHLFSDPRATPAASAEPFAAADPATIRSPIVEFDADEGRPAAALVEDFVRWGVEHYPADHVAVIVWGHGQGWRGRPEAGDARPVRYEEREGGLVGGIAFDHTQAAVLDIPSLADALARAGAGLRAAADDPPFDLVLADACLMQTASVVAGLSGLADYLGGYEPIAPYPGLPYRRLLPALDREPAAPRPGCRAGDRACDFAASLPAIYREAVAEGHYDLRAAYEPPVAETYAISIVAAEPLRERLLPALERLGGALGEWLAEAPIRAVELQDLLGARGLPGFLGGARDLGVLIDGLADAARRESARDGAPSPGTAALAQAIEALRRDLDATVLAQASGARYVTQARPQGLAGLAVWLPRSADELARRLPDFASAPLFADPSTGAATAWQRWIAATFTAPE
ncbi:MAG: clostripain-related cysteine peptidase [Nannocystaceae bacterium]